MKNIFRLLSVAVLCVVATASASAQIYYGVRAGANVPTVASAEGFDISGKPSYQAGIFVGGEIPLIGIGVEAEALYVDTKISYANIVDVKSGSFEVPIMVVVPVAATLPISIKAGPTFVFAQDVVVDAIGKDITIDKDVTLSALKPAVGYTVGLGFNFSQFTLDVRYNGQFTGVNPLEKYNILNIETNYGDIRTNTISASLGYRF